MTGRKLSFPRLILLIFFVVAAGFLIRKTWHEKENIIINTNFKPWFAPYVDATSKPTYAFEQLGSTNKSEVILSFIVSSNDDPCLPSWGTYFTLDEAYVSLDLDRRIARLRQQGGNVAISFGGALNSELAVKCTDENNLIDAYKSVIERYKLDTIDLDIENQALSDNDSLIRRAKAITQIQKNYRTDGKNLAVWLTLPVTPQGLSQEGTNAVSVFLNNGVDLAGINVMTMDYGNSKDKTQSMSDASKSALSETHRQLGILYKNSGIQLSDASLWRKIGATPMIGQNDDQDEVFTLQDAADLNQFAQTKGIGRISMWSANRDVPCGDNYVDLKLVSDSCSGVKDAKGSFSSALSKNYEGDFTQNSAVVTEAEKTVESPKVDDPEKSPYQIWKENGAYPKGVKVVWHGNVYEAKWWTKNDVPDNPVLQSWETPWQLIGPVLPGDKPIEQPTLPTGTYPNWSGTVIYNGGDRVLFEGVPFQAKWWNQGESPAASASNPDSSPWLPLTQKQIEEILKELGQ